MQPHDSPPSDGTRRAVVALTDSLRLDAHDADRASGRTIDIGSPAVFGGHVLSQALIAAARTVDVLQPPHSLHAYFIRAGDKSAPIDYEATRVRDGASFSTRQVSAVQHDQVIFDMVASFHRTERGSSHQDAMPDVPPPEALKDDAALKRAMLDQLPERMRTYWRGDRAVEFRPCESESASGAVLRSARPPTGSSEVAKPDSPESRHAPASRPPRHHTWMRVADRVADDPLLHQALLAYLSDFGLLSAALLPHGLHFTQPGVMAMSLDHAMWFHRPFRADEWLLYATDSPSADAARGFCRGSVFSRDGRLVASVAQEGLVRVRAPR